MCIGLLIAALHEFNKTVHQIPRFMSDRVQFQSQVKASLVPILKAEGFRQSGTMFRRIMGDVIHIIQIQGSRVCRPRLIGLRVWKRRDVLVCHGELITMESPHFSWLLFLCFDRLAARFWSNTQTIHA